jgi:hypothetical protein
VDQKDWLTAKRVYLLGRTKIINCPLRWPNSGVNIMLVTKQPASFRRRKLSTVVRKAITSYYTDQEQMEIEKAAKQEKISKSSFVASAALKEARRIIR